MNPQNLSQLLAVMQEMADLELALAGFYQACSEVYPEDQHFWLAIQRQEIQHSESLRKIAALVAASPQDFRINRSFNVTAIRTIRKGISDRLDTLKLRTTPRSRMLTIARDFENSLLEAKYGELVATSNVEFMKVMNSIDTETRTHKDLIARKLASIASA